MDELLKTKRYGQSKYAEFHNVIFSLLEKGYSVQKITDFLNENYQGNFNLKGIYTYIHRQKLKGNTSIVETIPTEKEKGIQNSNSNPEDLAGQPKQVSRGNAASAFAELVSKPVTRQKQDDVLFDDD